MKVNYEAKTDTLGFLLKEGASVAESDEESRVSYLIAMGLWFQSRFSTPGVALRKPRRLISKLQAEL